MADGLDKNGVDGSPFDRMGEFLRAVYPGGVRPDQFEDMLRTVRALDKIFLESGYVVSGEMEAAELETIMGRVMRSSKKRRLSAEVKRLEAAGQLQLFPTESVSGESADGGI
jgi:hypothetical protein